MRTGALWLAASLWAGATGAAWAQGAAAFPSKPVRIVVGFPPGVPGDVMARVIAPRLADGLGQQVIVDNKPGAGSSIGAEAVVRSPADGHTLYVSSIANSVNQSLYKLAFDFATDLAPISLIADVPGLLVAHPSVPSALREVVEKAKARPGELSFGSSGNGTATHLYGELFNLATGASLSHIPYKGSSQTVTDLIAGRIQLMFTPGSTVMPHVKAGKLKALGAIGKQRLAALPDVPTLAENGIAGYEAAFWFGLNAPAGTPKPVIERLNRELARVLDIPEVRTQLTAQSIDPGSSTIEAFAAFIRSDVDKWARVVKAAGVKGD